jgi:hypothetical protein
MRAVITRTFAAAALASACALAHAAPTISLSGGALFNDTGNNFGGWFGGTTSSVNIWEGGTISITDASWVRIEYFGKEAAFSNNEFWWGTLGPYGTGTKVATTGVAPPVLVPNPVPPSPGAPLSTTSVTGFLSGVMPFYFGITDQGAGAPVPRVVENGHNEGTLTDDIGFWFGPASNGGGLPRSGTSVWVLLDDGGGGQDNDHDDMVIRLTAEVPEPSTYMLLLAGLGLLGFMARRRMQG